MRGTLRIVHTYDVQLCAVQKVSIVYWVMPGAVLGSLVGTVLGCLDLSVNRLTPTKEIHTASGHKSW